MTSTSPRKRFRGASLEEEKDASVLLPSNLSSNKEEVQKLATLCVAHNNGNSSSVFPTTANLKTPNTDGLSDSQGAPRPHSCSPASKTPSDLLGPDEPPQLLDQENQEKCGQETPMIDCVEAVPHSEEKNNNCSSSSNDEFASSDVRPKSAPPQSPVRSPKPISLSAEPTPLNQSPTPSKIKPSSKNNISPRTKSNENKIEFSFDQIKSLPPPIQYGEVRLSYSPRYDAQSPQNNVLLHDSLFSSKKPMKRPPPLPPMALLRQSIPSIEVKLTPKSLLPSPPVPHPAVYPRKPEPTTWIPSFDKTKAEVKPKPVMRVESSGPWHSGGRTRPSFPSSTPSQSSTPMLRKMPHRLDFDHIVEPYKADSPKDSTRSGPLGLPHRIPLDEKNDEWVEQALLYHPQSTTALTRFEPLRNGTRWGKGRAGALSAPPAPRFEEDRFAGFKGPSFGSPDVSHDQLPPPPPPAKQKIRSRHLSEKDSTSAGYFLGGKDLTHSLIQHPLNAPADLLKRESFPSASFHQFHRIENPHQLPLLGFPQPDPLHHENPSFSHRVDNIGTALSYSSSSMRPADSELLETRRFLKPSTLGSPPALDLADFLPRDGQDAILTCPSAQPLDAEKGANPSPSLHSNILLVGFKAKQKKNDASLRKPLQEPEDPRGCPTKGCDGSGHSSGKFKTHFTLSGCPKATEEELRKYEEEEASRDPSFVRCARHPLCRKGYKHRGVCKLIPGGKLKMPKDDRSCLQEGDHEEGLELVAEDYLQGLNTPNPEIFDDSLLLGLTASPTTLRLLGNMHSTPKSDLFSKALDFGDASLHASPPPPPTSSGSNGPDLLTPSPRSTLSTSPHTKVLNDQNSSPDFSAGDLRPLPSSPLGKHIPKSRPSHFSPRRAIRSAHAAQEKLLPSGASSPEHAPSSSSNINPTRLPQLFEASDNSLFVTHEELSQLFSSSNEERHLSGDAAQEFSEYGLF